MANSLFSKTQRLIEFIADKPVRAQIVSHLSRELSPGDEPCAVALVQLSKEGTLHCIAADGFVIHDPFANNGVPIESNRPSSVAMRNPKLKIFSSKEFKELMTFASEEERRYWRSAATIPVGAHLMFFILFRDDVTDVRHFLEYLYCMESLLKIFEQGLKERNGRNHLSWFQGETRELTERESRIEEYIRQGLTNAQIAAELGYSESLIRQETVVIYRKLGVVGRKDLVAKERKSERFIKRSRDAIQAVIAISSIELLSPLVTTLEVIQEISS